MDRSAAVMAAGHLSRMLALAPDGELMNTNTACETHRTVDGPHFAIEAAVGSRHRAPEQRMIAHYLDSGVLHLVFSIRSLPTQSTTWTRTPA